MFGRRISLTYTPFPVMKRLDLSGLTLRPMNPVEVEAIRAYLFVARYSPLLIARTRQTGWNLMASVAGRSIRELPAGKIYVASLIGSSSLISRALRERLRSDPTDRKSTRLNSSHLVI